MTIGRFIRLSRPRFWFYLLGPVLIGGVSAITNSETNVSIEDFWFLIILLLFATLPANALIYGVNDLADYDTDHLNAKKDGYESLLDRRDHWTTVVGILVLTIPFVIALIYLKNAFGIFVSLFFFFGIGYSLPPIRAKAIPIVDMLFNALYLFLGFGAYYALTGEIGSPAAWIGGIAWVMAMHAYSAVPDISADTKAGLATTATKLGADNTIVLCASLWMVSTICAIVTLGPMGGAGLIYPALMLVALKASREQRFKIYKLFPILNVTIGALLFWTIVLSSYSF